MDRNLGGVKSAYLTNQGIQERLERYKNRNKKTTMTRECLIEFVTSEFGFQISHL